MNHRGDVQILRGVAVLLVVLFHLGLTDFGSGFLGVDIFFVISGYLMALMFNPATPGDFFVRRSRRLLPAYFVTIIATVIATAVIATPNELEQVARQAWYALLFVPNIGYWFANSYFDKAEFKPLLHLWSLGVEMQFYALVPLVAVFIRRFRLPGLIGLGLMSAFLCFVLVGVSPKTAFFWLPTRIWEFLLGFGVGTVLGSSVTRVGGARWLGLAGLLAVISIPMIPVEGDGLGFIHGHPGLAAMAVTVATALVIACGLPGGLQASLPGRALERLGDWSYSIYLAHFPALVLFYQRPFGGTSTEASSPAELGWALVCVAIASILLYRCVERPLRRHPLGRPALIAGVTAVLIAIIPGPLIQAMTLSEQQRSIFAARSDRDTYRCGKSWRILHPTARTCPLNDPPNATMELFLVGNSHADSLKQALVEVADLHGVRVHLTVENSPLMPQGQLGPREIVDQAQALGAGAIVIHFSREVINPDAIETVVREARARGIETSFIMPVPAPVDHVPRLLWAANQAGSQPRLTTLDDYRRQHDELARRLHRIDVPSFRIYDVADVFCGTDCRVRDDAGTPLYFDGGHLTLTGSRLLKERFDAVITELLDARAIPMHTSHSDCRANCNP